MVMRVQFYYLSIDSHRVLRNDSVFSPFEVNFWIMDKNNKTLNKRIMDECRFL